MAVLPFIRRGDERFDAALQRLQETSQEDWFWGRLSSSGTEEDYYWRRLSDNWSQKDVLPATYLDIHNQCYEAYNANPLANAIVEMGVNFVLGDGLTITASHPRVQGVLDAFWESPDNRMNLRQYDLATELSLYGELFIRFFVNPHTGAVTVRQIDPSLIDEIECDVEDIETVLRVHRRAISVAPSSDSLPHPTDPGMKGQWLSVPDEVMHFAVNKVSNAKRGKSDLATLLPWLRRYKDWLIDRVRINKYKGAFLWDVKLSGADRTAIGAKLMEYARPPEPGSVLVHNESEEWTAVQPSIGADDVAADGHAIKLMIAMGAGLPEHYLSDGGDVNRATAAEMGLPVLKRYQRRQDYLGYVLRAVLDRVILEAQKAKRLPRAVDTGYALRFPALLPEGEADGGMAAWHTAQAIEIARGLGIVSRETASRMFFAASREEVDAREEIRRIDREDA